MEKIINGKRYNTETAELIAEREENVGSFDHIHEELYRKRTGEFFISGEGGARTAYARRIEQNTWTNGCALVPITDEEAKAWLEKYADAETYERCFAVDEEDDRLVRLSVDITQEDSEKLRAYARRGGKSVADVVRMMIARLEE